MSHSAKEILRMVKKNWATIQKFEVKRLGLFGSVARGEDNPKSDLDFLVDFQRKTFDNYMDLKFYLEDLFNKPVDLVITENLKPRIRPQILNEVIYA